MAMLVSEEEHGHGRGDATARTKVRADDALTREGAGGDGVPIGRDAIKMLTSAFFSNLVGCVLCFVATVPYLHLCISSSTRE